MPEANAEGGVVNARIVFWGIAGSGKTATLRAIFAKLRPDHRGELRDVPTPFDPTVTYEELPIELGEIAGIRTQIYLVAVPSNPEQAPTRKHILDQVDGVVLVLDSQRERIEENVASVRELRKLLADYGRSLEEMPLVVQYNKRDLVDPYVLEELHRRLGLGPTTVFETVATENTGVLQTLSTISKHVIRTLRERGVDEKPEPVAAEAPTVIEKPAMGVFAGGDPGDLAAAPADSSTSERMENAILREHENPEMGAIEETATRAQTLLDTTWEQVAGEIERSTGIRVGPDLSIVSVGEATRSGERAVRVPLVLGDGEGNTSTLVLTIQLDPLTDEN